MGSSIEYARPANCRRTFEDGGDECGKCRTRKTADGVTGPGGGNAHRGLDNPRGVMQPPEVPPGLGRVPEAYLPGVSNIDDLLMDLNVQRSLRQLRTSSRLAQASVPGHHKH